MTATGLACRVVHAAWSEFSRRIATKADNINPVQSQGPHMAVKLALAMDMYKNAPVVLKPVARPLNTQATQPRVPQPSAILQSTDNAALEARIQAAIENADLAQKANDVKFAHREKVLEQEAARVLQLSIETERKTALSLERRLKFLEAKKRAEERNPTSESGGGSGSGGGGGSGSAAPVVGEADWRTMFPQFDKKFDLTTTFPEWNKLTTEGKQERFDAFMHATLLHFDKLKTEKIARKVALAFEERFNQRLTLVRIVNDLNRFSSTASPYQDGVHGYFYPMSLHVDDGTGDFVNPSLLVLLDRLETVRTAYFK